MRLTTSLLPCLVIAATAAAGATSGCSAPSPRNEPPPIHATSDANEHVHADGNEEGNENETEDPLGDASPDPFDSSNGAQPDPFDPSGGASSERGEWPDEDGRSYLVPALEIISFNALLNLFDRVFIDEDEFGSDLHSIQRNLGHGAVIDEDNFSTNQLHHPYTGAIYHGFARSAGLDYWTSLGYDLAGSALWEIAGETTPPSANDFIATGIGGSFLGEALFRISSLVLEDGGEEPSVGREIGAALISPTSAINRHAFGDRFHYVYPSGRPAVTSRLRVGSSFDTRFSNEESSKTIDRTEAFANFSLDYGLPGRAGYEYDRPFDYFYFEAAVSTSKDAYIENVISRGLLVGEEYGEGDYRGIWGLYGSLDYIAPRIFRIGSTAASIGTTGQWWISDDLTMQCTGLAGVGYGAAGNVDEGNDLRDYHYGVTPQALLGVRLMVGQIAMLDLSGREYYVSNLASDGGDGAENIARADASLTFRILGRHALGLQYMASWRDAHYSDLADRDQFVGTLSLFYCYLSDEDFGVVPRRGGRGRR